MLSEGDTIHTHTGPLTIETLTDEWIQFRDTTGWTWQYDRGIVIKRLQTGRLER